MVGMRVAVKTSLVWVNTGYRAVRTHLDSDLTEAASSHTRSAPEN